MATVRDFLKVKGHQVWSVSPSTSLRAALLIMAKQKIGALLVLEDNRVVGIFSERDYARAAVEMSPLNIDTPVGELMTSPVYYVTPLQSADEVMALMTAKHIRHLPVIEEDKLVGVISVGDVVKSIIHEKEEVIKDLEDTIWVHSV
jgi:CBS domain-containing protein